MTSVLEERAANVRVASSADSVYRDECVYSFDSPLSPEGLYTNLTTFESVGKRFLPLDLTKSPNAIYLHQKFTKSRRNYEDKKEIPTKLAIGIEGGFSTNSENEKFEVLKKCAICTFEPKSEREIYRIEYPSDRIPCIIREAVDAVLNHAGSAVTETVATWQEQIKETRYAEDLIQIPDPPKLSSDRSTWRCSASNCDKAENLWLNLSDGYIGCGRKNWDGSGGCGAALDHYKETGYPLAVKLGTITAKGGDVYSYASDEDDLVADKYLAKHLAHFGINIVNLKKTDKSMNELQVGLNMSYEFDQITESGKNLIPISGAGHMGFKNLGNSCYINSVLQLLLALPEMKNRYFDAASDIFATCSGPAAKDFVTQMAKVATAALSDRYKRKDADDETDQAPTIDLRPSTFRKVVGENHPSFSTQEQQDAVEYLQYLLDFMKKHEHMEAHRIGPLLVEVPITQNLPSSQLFKFRFEDRIECQASGKVKYIEREDLILRLQIPLQLAVNASEVEEYHVSKSKRQRVVNKDNGGDSMVDEKVIAVVDFEACLHKAFEPNLIEGFVSPATNAKGTARQTVRMKSFPRYLLLQMARFYASEDWTPKKLDAFVTVPEKISLGRFKATGPCEGEEFLPHTDNELKDNVAPDEALVAQLVSMGFSENGCKRAAIATRNGTAEAAMEWIFSHMEDSDFNEPLSDKRQTDREIMCSTELVSVLTSMGFTEEQATCALINTDMNADRAAQWLLSRIDDLDSAIAGSSSLHSETHEHLLDSPDCGDYSLIGFISHIGKNSNSGHYVCHLKKEERWIIYNDDKVAISKEPPFSSGFLYLFKREDAQN